MDIYNVIDKLQYGKQFEKLCYRFLKNCQIKENINLEYPAEIVSTRKNVYISYNPKHIFYRNEKDLKFVLLHEAAHFLFGHLYIDVSKYDKAKLNIVWDASINSYILDNIDHNRVSCIAEYKNNTIVSGLKSIFDKHTWEYMYTNFPENKNVLEEENKNNSKKQDNNEFDNANNRQSDKQQNISSSTFNDAEENTEKQNDTYSQSNNNENLNDQNNTNSLCNNEENSEKQNNIDSQSNDKENILIEQDTNNSNNNSNLNNKTSIFQNNQNTEPLLSNNDSNRKDYLVDNHSFHERPSKAVEARFKEIIIEAMEDLDIKPGSVLGQLLVKGLNFYQDTRQEWKRTLSKAVIKAIKIRGRESTWLRPNKRTTQQAIPLPGKRKLYYPIIGVLVDCSGSMISYLPSVVGHIAHISSSTGGIDYLIGGDIRKTIEYKNVTKAKLKEIEFKGLGGTYLSDMIKELTKKELDILILITDLELCTNDMNTIKNIIKKISTILCIPKNYYTDKLVTELSNIKIIPISKEET